MTDDFAFLLFLYIRCKTILHCKLRTFLKKFSHLILTFGDELVKAYIKHFTFDNITEQKSSKPFYRNAFSFTPQRGIKFIKWSSIPARIWWSFPIFHSFTSSYETTWCTSATWRYAQLPPKIINYLIYLKFSEIFFRFRQSKATHNIRIVFVVLDYIITGTAVCVMNRRKTNICCCRTSTYRYSRGHNVSNVQNHRFLRYFYLWYAVWSTYWQGLSVRWCARIFEWPKTLKKTQHFWILFATLKLMTKKVLSSCTRFLLTFYRKLRPRAPLAGHAY